MVVNMHTGIWMCRAKDTNILVMDVEGTDGRERGEDQVGDDQSYESENDLRDIQSRTLNANRLYSPLLRPKFLLSIFGNTKLDSIKEPTWVS